jgi:hypothetical protein
MTFGLQSTGGHWLLECALESFHKRSCVMSVKVRHLPSSLTIFSTPRVFLASLVCPQGTSSEFVCHAYCTTLLQFLVSSTPNAPHLGIVLINSSLSRLPETITAPFVAIKQVLWARIGLTNYNSSFHSLLKRRITRIQAINHINFSLNQ